jgi:uncharacterized membrane protein YbhN (UPF0104 family)
MRNLDFKRMIRLAGSLAAFVLLVVLLSQQGWAEIWTSVQQIAGWRFAAAVALMGLSRVSVAMRWHTLLNAAGVPIPARQSLRITFSGLFASNFLPTTIGGDVVRLAMVLRLEYDRVISAASLIVDRLVGMAGMGTAALFGISPLLESDLLERLTVTGASGAAALPERVRSIVRRLFESSILWARSPRSLLVPFLLTWVHQVCVFGINGLLLQGLGEPLPFWSIAGFWSFTYFVTLLPISINGLGVQELSMTFIFTTLGGVSVSTAATAALLVRTLQMLASLPGAAFLPDILSGMRQPQHPSKE